MTENINIVINKDRHPEIFEYFEKYEGRPLYALNLLFNDHLRLNDIKNERQESLNEYSKFMMKELVPLRLAIREIEKDSWIMKQLKNSEINDIQTFHEQRYEKLWPTKKVKAKVISQLETQWEDYINELNIRHNEREGKILKQREDELKNKEV